jgi:splicing suppressor protein 51
MANMSLCLRSDCFFTFSPGFGFPDEVDSSKPQATTNWSKSLSQILSTKCPLFCTGFSPQDIERDVLALDSLTTEGIRGEFDWVMTPGDNIFRSEKWEILEQDPRVAVKSNWGLWGIRGRLYEVDETTLQLQ